MARHKEFNQDVVLDKAMKLFWQHGYEAASTRILLDGMGIGRGSFYDTFGSKHNLYLAALQRYQETSSGKIFASVNDPTLAASLTATEKIERIFDTIIDEAMGPNGRWGCLLINTAVELAHIDKEVEKTSRLTVDMIEQIFHQLLTEAQEEGELSTDKDITQISHALVNTFLGIRVLAKMNPKRQLMQDSVDAALTMLR